MGARHGERRSSGVPVAAVVVVLGLVVAAGVGYAVMTRRAPAQSPRTAVRQRGDTFDKLSVPVLSTSKGGDRRDVAASVSASGARRDDEGRATVPADALAGSGTSAAPDRPLVTCAVEPAADLRAIIAEIESRCPAEYPAVVEPVPGHDELAKMSPKRLVGMLRHWNMAVRGAAAGELASRGPAVVLVQ